MNNNQFNARLGWLSIALAQQRNNLAEIFLRLKDVTLRVGTSLGLHKKFLSLMEQIQYDREIERDILHEIEEVEKRHAEMKERKMLRQASPEIEALKAKPIIIDDQVEKPKRHGILTLFGLLLLFSQRSIKHKKQDLTVD